MSLLIYGSPQDPHVAALRWALESLDRPCAVLDYSAFPTGWHSACAIDREGRTRTTSRLSGLSPVEHEAFDTVWNRRAPSVGHLPTLAAAEIELARSVSRIHLDDLRALERPGQLWVNPVRSRGKSTTRSLNCGSRPSLASKSPER